MANLPSLIPDKDLLLPAVAQFLLAAASIELVPQRVAPDGTQSALWCPFAADASTTLRLLLALNALTSDGGQSA